MSRIKDLQFEQMAVSNYVSLLGSIFGFQDTDNIKPDVLKEFWDISQTRDQLLLKKLLHPKNFIKNQMFNFKQLESLNRMCIRYKLRYFYSSPDSQSKRTMRAFYIQKIYQNCNVDFFCDLNKYENLLVLDDIIYHVFSSIKHYDQISKYESLFNIGMLQKDRVTSSNYIWHWFCQLLESKLNQKTFDKKIQ